MFVKKVMPFSKNATVERQYRVVSFSTKDLTVSNIHDTTSVLHDATIRVMLHFTDAVEHAIARNTGVGVDDEDVVADADVACDY